MNTIHQHRMKWYVDGCRVLHEDPGSIAPCHWKLSPKPSPAAIQKDGCRAFAFQILDPDEAIDYLRQRHCCGILFTSQPIQFGAFPSGWAWINNDALPPVRSLGPPASPSPSSAGASHAFSGRALSKTEPSSPPAPASACRTELHAMWLSDAITLTESLKRWVPTKHGSNTTNLSGSRSHSLCCIAYT